MTRLANYCILAAACFLAVAFSASTARAEDFLGDIKLVATNFDQRNWVHCEGQVVPLAENTALFSLLGSTYGGDGKTSFKLPDLRKAEAALRTAAGVKEDGPYLRYVICIAGVYPSRR